MEKAISIVGGDLRIVRLIEMLIADGYKVYTFKTTLANKFLKIKNTIIEIKPI